MAMLSLKISIVGDNVVKTMQFEPSTVVYDACRIIRGRTADVKPGNPSDYGLFLADEDPKKGVWLEQGRSLEYYLLRNADLLEYKLKYRILKVRTLDGALKTLQVDDSHSVGHLMIPICSRMGITNHEEYSLVRELPEDEKEKMMTLRRDKTIAKDQKKLEEMKKKLHTDDELNWLDHSKTLREQDIEQSEILLLRRKFFYSDQNVDARDPVQLNLLYVQSRDAILSGAHPVSFEEATNFAGLQCQVQFGDHVDSKHKPGFLDLKEFLPKEYVKLKGSEKKVFTEHKKYAGLSEVDAKVQYTHQCRSLKTYGITFFLVKEKMKGKNKLVPRLLGITKESVVRVDEKTKEIMKTWPLTTVRRWAASPNSFTLDFGDYSNSFYSVQTSEGEQISQLIAGYIDIILRKKKAKDHLGVDGDDNSMMYEDIVQPARATIIERNSPELSHPSTGSVAIPGILRDGYSGQNQYSTDSLDRAQFSQTSSHMGAYGKASLHGQAGVRSATAPAQRAFIVTMEEGLGALQAAMDDLDKKTEIPTIGNDNASRRWRENQLDLSRQKATAQLSSMNAATVQLTTMTAGAQNDDEVDYAAIGAAVSGISSNIGQLSHDVKTIAALVDNIDGGDRLLNAAQNLCVAFSDFLNVAQPDSKQPRQNLLAAVGRIGEVSQEVLEEIGYSATDMDKAFQDTLMSLAKAVANTTAALVLKAKSFADALEPGRQKDHVISSATLCAQSTSQLVACTKVVGPTISQTACQEQLIEAAKLVAKSMDTTVFAARSACSDGRLVQDLGQVASAVSLALNHLLQHIKKASGPTKAHEQHDQSVDMVISVTDRLISSTGDAHEMVKQAKHLAECITISAQATSMLVSAIRCHAGDEASSAVQNRLLMSAKQLADATAKLIEAAKGCASSPNDNLQQEKLRSAAEDVRLATNTAASNALKRRLVDRLETAVKQAASASTQLVNSVMHANKTNCNSLSQQQTEIASQALDDAIPDLIHAWKVVVRNQDSATSQLALIHRSHDFIQVALPMMDACNAVLPTVTDNSSSLHLQSAVKAMSLAVAELRSAADKAQEACGPLEVESALDLLESVDGELADTQKAALSGALCALPGETAEGAAITLGTSCKTVGSAIGQLLTAAANVDDNYVGLAARHIANAVKSLSNAVRAVAATTSDNAANEALISYARDVVSLSRTLLPEAQDAAHYSSNAKRDQCLAACAKEVNAALSKCLDCLPGQRNLDLAVSRICARSLDMSLMQFPSTDKSYAEVQGQMNCEAAELHQAAMEIVSSFRGPPQRLSSSSTRYSHLHEQFIDTGLTMASLSKDAETQGQIVGGLKSVSITSSKLLSSAKAVSADPSTLNAKNMLMQAAREVAESINRLMDVCHLSAPGQKECDNAFRQVQVIRNLLDYPVNEPISDLTYHECLDAVMERSKVLGEAMTGISNSAKQCQFDQFCQSVGMFADSISGLAEAIVQAAYLVGIADPASAPGRPGIADQMQFHRANQAIQTACQNLADSTSSQEQVLSAATVIAKHTSALCSACRLASSRTANQVAKRHFVNSAKGVANCTAALVKAIKVLDCDFTDDHRRLCAVASKPLTDAVEELTTFASSPEFASKPAKISVQAAKAQEPMLQSAGRMLDGAVAMLTVAKQLAVDSRQAATYQQYSAHSKHVSDAIKGIVGSMRGCAPGRKEVDAAIERLSSLMRELDATALDAIRQSLAQRDTKTLKGFQEQMMTSGQQLVHRADEFRQAAKQDSVIMAHLVTTITPYFESLTESVIGAVSKTVSSKQQMNLLDLMKTVLESEHQLLCAAKDGGGDPKAVQAHQAIDGAADDVRDVLQDLLRTVEDAACQAGIVSNMIDSISKAMSRTDVQQDVNGGPVSFVDGQTRVVQLAKQIARTVQDMVARSTSDPTQLGILANQLTRDYVQLSSASCAASTCSASSNIANRIRSSVQDLGRSCVEVVQDAGALQADPTDAYSRQELCEHSLSVNEKVSYVLAGLQAGARGTQACMNAASTMSGIIGDLDTTIMFASAGTLNPEADERFADQRENILKTAKALVEDTKVLVAGAASNQEQLAAAAQAAVKTITRLADVVKVGAGALGCEQNEAQVLLINAVKDVASALSDLISATKNASGKPVTKPSMQQLKDLAKTVKSVEDETVRGTRALESAMEAISQEIKAFDANDRAVGKCSVEDLIRLAKPVTVATAKAVAAGNSCHQHDIIAASNLGRKCVSDLLTAIKGVAATAETAETRKRALHAGRNTGLVYRELLDTLLLIVNRPSREGRQALAVVSRKVANAVTEVMQSAEIIKDCLPHMPSQLFPRGFASPPCYADSVDNRWLSPSPRTGSDWVDPDDLTVIAENELLNAAMSIEAAANKLAQLKPRPVAAKKADEGLNFDEQILEAAKSIAAATAALVKSASAAQRELVAQGKVSSTFTRRSSDEDGQWSQGLISAARTVAAATHSLCEASNAVVLGHAGEEKLIASAKEVAGSTAQLLMACKVKADMGSIAMQRLQAAGNAVKRASEALVRAAQQDGGVHRKDDVDGLTINQRVVGGIAQEIMAQEEILRKERELHDARRRLEKIRKGKYKDRQSEDGEETSSSF